MKMDVMAQKELFKSNSTNTRFYVKGNAGDLVLVHWVWLQLNETFFYIIPKESGLIFSRAASV